MPRHIRGVIIYSNNHLTAAINLKESPRKFAIYSIIASIVTLGLKFGAYFITDSVGILSDALESTVNLAAALFALAAITIAMQPADSEHAYGHGKAEYFSSGAEGMLILFAAIGIIYASIERFLSPMPPNNLAMGLIVALIAGAVNYLTAKVMLNGARKYDSITLEADAKHLMTDVWTSAGLLAGIAIMLVTPPKWSILDPIIAIIMALNIIYTGFQLIKKSYSGLMDMSLPLSELKLIDKSIRKFGGSNTIYHGLRTRKSGSARFVDFHFLVPGTTTIEESHAICDNIEHSIKEKIGKNTLVTIHVEPMENQDSYDCEQIGGLCGTKIRADLAFDCDDKKNEPK